MLYFRPVENDLEDYYDWMTEYQEKHPDQPIFISQWLFPSIKNPSKHIDERRYYMIMHKVGEVINIDYLGTHTMRKTGAYRVYEQSKHSYAAIESLIRKSYFGLPWIR